MCRKHGFHISILKISDLINIKGRKHQCIFLTVKKNVYPTKVLTPVIRSKFASYVLKEKSILSRRLKPVREPIPNIFARKIPEGMKAKF